MPDRFNAKWMNEPTMTDPFNNRPEDFLNRGIKAVVGALPIVGGSLNEFLAFVIGDPAQERRDDFMRATLERLIKLEGTFEKLKPDALRANEQFHATFVQSARLSVATASDEKRKLLQNAILNSAIGTIDENVRQIFMQFVERITPLHAAMLKLLNDPTANAAAKQRADNLMTGGLGLIVQAALPILQGNDALANRLANDLEAYGLLNGANLNVTMTGQGLMASRTTELGRAFLNFITDPETGEVP
jgi:hypothetical protein